ncbi:MAG: hypothetical protein JW990_08295, partial [Thermoleophilia bacterium]|nr:hypothetical protein [Thermoleophilia bacterium]
GGSKRLLLVVDQFEELFTQCRDAGERRAFVDNLLTAAGVPSPSQGEGSGGGPGPAIVVIALRADFYHHCAQFENLRDALEKHQAYIGPMTPDELRRAIEEPAHAGDWRFEPGLVDLLLRDVGDEPGALPLLSHALLETWQRRRGHALTLEGYAEAGGVRGAIAETAENVYRRLDERQQAIARNIFLRLTELGEGTEDTRRRAALEELFPRPEEATAVEAVLGTLADARLITTERETVQVAHEALIREWPTLQEWLEEDREGLRVHRHLTEAAGEWQRMGRDAGELYRGARLAQASEWARVHAGALNPLEREFLAASEEWVQRREEEREAQRQRELEAARKLAEAEGRRVSVLRRGALGLAGVSLVAIVLAVVALFARQQAAEQREEARRQASIGLGAQALLELEGDSPERAALLALEALENYPYTWQAERALGQAILSNRLRLVLQHENSVAAVQWSSDGTQILTASNDGTAKVWDASASSPTYGEELLTISGHQGVVVSAEWSPSGDRIVTAGWDGTAKVWDAVTGEELLTFAQHRDAVVEAEWSPDGTRIATTSKDATARVWNPLTGEELFHLSAQVFYGHTSKRSGLAWSPSGDRIVIAGGDGTAKVWDGATGERLLTLSGHADLVQEATWSPDGMRIVTAGWDGTAKVWDASASSPTYGEELLTFRGHTSWVESATWSPSGETIISTADDGTAKIWDAATGDELLDLYSENPPPWVMDAVWSPSGERVVTLGGDGTATVWDAATGAELLVAGRPELAATGNAAITYGAAWSPSGDRIVIAGMDGTAKVWDLASGPELLTLYGHTEGLSSVAWSPSGDRILTGDWDNRARVWDAITGAELLALQGSGIMEVAWSPSGENVLTVDVGDDTVRVQDVSTALAPGAGAATGRWIAPITRIHHGDLSRAVWSPDGGRIATSGHRIGLARVWDASTGEHLLTLSGHEGGIATVE